MSERRPTVYVIFIIIAYTPVNPVLVQVPTNKRVLFYQSVYECTDYLTFLFTHLFTCLIKVEK